MDVVIVCHTCRPPKSCCSNPAWTRVQVGRVEAKLGWLVAEHWIPAVQGSTTFAQHLARNELVTKH